MQKNGFTLIELMIVISIIGILAGIAVPSYQSYTVRAQVSEGLILANEIKQEIHEFYKRKGRFPKNNHDTGVPDAKYLMGNYVKRMEIKDGALHITYGNKVSELVSGQVLTVRPIVVKNSPASPISWNCGNAVPPEGMEAIGENRTTVSRQFLVHTCRK